MLTTRVQRLQKEFEQKLQRQLNEEEKSFIRWMVAQQEKENHSVYVETKK